MTATIRHVFKSNSLVYTGLNDFSVLSGYLQRTGPQERIFLLVDENTRRLCLPILLDALPLLNNAIIVEIPAGERYKSIGTAELVWNQLASGNAGRKSLLICLGGGVLTDLGGFTAAAYHRGIPFIHLPTTLIGMVDAAIGGKTGVNLNQVKNQVGVFALPEAVFVFPVFLNTLPFREMASGWAEILKSALIADPQLWNRLLTQIRDGISPFSNSTRKLVPLINACIRIKSGVVRRDFREEGVRKILNFGHTVGHALESWSLLHDDEPLSHGEAIAAGMICEGYLSVALRRFPSSDFQAMTDLILNTFGHISFPRGISGELEPLLLCDKKNRDGKVKLVLLRSVGQPEWDCDCSMELIHEALRHYQQLSGGD